MKLFKSIFHKAAYLKAEKEFLQEIENASVNKEDSSSAQPTTEESFTSVSAPFASAPERAQEQSSSPEVFSNTSEDVAGESPSSAASVISSLQSDSATASTTSTYAKPKTESSSAKGEVEAKSQNSSSSKPISSMPENIKEAHKKWLQSWLAKLSLIHI